MGCWNYEDLENHIGHKLQCVRYGDENVAVECIDCQEIIMDYEKYPYYCRKCGWLSERETEIENGERWCKNGHRLEE